VHPKSFLIFLQPAAMTTAKYRERYELNNDCL